MKLEELADPKYKKIAIANPDHAPYGKAAQQALEKAGIWNQVQSKIVLARERPGNDAVRAHRQRRRSIVALSLAVVSDGGSFLKIDDSMHDPLDQAMVVCGNGAEADAAHQFEDFCPRPTAARS